LTLHVIGDNLAFKVAGGECIVTLIPQNRPLRVKNNVQCPYCGVDLRSLRADQKMPEHVIGRRFVPKGYLSGAWNLILDACMSCNRHKARLEDTISAMSHLTLLPADEMPDEVRQDLQRKLGAGLGKKRGAIHPATGQSVATSHTEHVFKSFFGPAEFTFSFVSPPQCLEMDSELAKMQVQAFFYMSCNVNAEDIQNSRAFTDQSRIIPRSYVHDVEILRRSDWGNPMARELVKRTRCWEARCVINTARGYFRAELRRSPPDSEPAYFWAVEWNTNVRVLGVIGEPDRPNPVERDLPTPQISWVSEDTGIRVETVLPEDEDLLFQ
jgi:hypothetical protein